MDALHAHATDTHSSHPIVDTPKIREERVIKPKSIALPWHSHLRGNQLLLLVRPRNYRGSLSRIVTRWPPSASRLSEYFQVVGFWNERRKGEIKGEATFDSKTPVKLYDNDNNNNHNNSNN